MLRSRTESVLKILINEYINTVTPVASEYIVQRLPQRVSPATIRNEMSELEDEGYITRPHISAGGVPSDKGYRFYVESLEDTPELPVAVQQHIRDQFSRAQRDQEVWTLQVPRVIEVMRSLDPRVVIPMHYSRPGLRVELGSLDDFFKEMGLRDVEPQNRLSISPSNVPQEMRTVVLEPQGQEVKDQFHLFC